VGEKEEFIRKKKEEGVRRGKRIISYFF